MASSQLYLDSLEEFKQAVKRRYQGDNKHTTMLRDFLKEREDPKDAQKAADGLRKRAGERLPAPWVKRLVENIEHFVTIGNYAMTGAPESIGLAWFAVKLTLSAIQSNYDLYLFFESALTDITEIMIIIPHYYNLYNERSKANKSKLSAMVGKLFDIIKAAYIAILSFSFPVKRHIRAGTLVRLRYGIRDFLGESKGRFEGDMATIAACKVMIFDDSQAIFQDNTLHQIDAVKSIVDDIQETVNEIASFQETFERMHKEQDAKLTLVPESTEDIKSTTKPKTVWDIANDTFEKNKKTLNPQKHTFDALVDALDQRHPGTCL